MIDSEADQSRVFVVTQGCDGGRLRDHGDVVMVCATYLRLGGHVLTRG